MALTWVWFLSSAWYRWKQHRRLDPYCLGRSVGRRTGEGGSVGGKTADEARSSSVRASVLGPCVSSINWPSKMHRRARRNRRERAQDMNESRERKEEINNEWMKERISVCNVGLLPVRIYMTMFRWIYRKRWWRCTNTPCFLHSCLCSGQINLSDTKYCSLLTWLHGNSLPCYICSGTEQLWKC